MSANPEPSNSGMLNEELIKPHSGRGALDQFLKKDSALVLVDARLAERGCVRVRGHKPAAPALSADRNYFYLCGAFDRRRPAQSLRTRRSRLHFGADGACLRGP